MQALNDTGKKHLSEAKGCNWPFYQILHRLINDVLRVVGIGGALIFGGWLIIKLLFKWLYWCYFIIIKSFKSGTGAYILAGYATA